MRVGMYARVCACVRVCVRRLLLYVYVRVVCHLTQDRHRLRRAMPLIPAATTVTPRRSRLIPVRLRRQQPSDRHR
jgi:hypothetical protein